MPYTKIASSVLVDAFLDEAQLLLWSGQLSHHCFSSVGRKLPKFYLRKNKLRPCQQFNASIFEDHIDATTLGIVNQFFADSKKNSTQLTSPYHHQRLTIHIKTCDCRIHTENTDLPSMTSWIWRLVSYSTARVDLLPIIHFTFPLFPIRWLRWNFDRSLGT